MEKLNQHDESMEKEKRKKRRWKEEDDNNNNSNQKKKIQRQHIQREHKVRPAVSEYVTTDFNQRRNLQLKNPKFKGRDQPANEDHGCTTKGAQACRQRLPRQKESGSIDND